MYSRLCQSVVRRTLNSPSMTPEVATFRHIQCRGIQHTACKLPVVPHDPLERHSVCVTHVERNKQPQLVHWSLSLPRIMYTFRDTHARGCGGQQRAFHTSYVAREQSLAAPVSRGLDSGDNVVHESSTDEGDVNSEGDVEGNHQTDGNVTTETNAGTEAESEQSLEPLVPPVEPDYCCGTGCDDCTWTIYFQELTEYQDKLMARVEANRAKQQSTSE
eukprot:GFYU01014255.1.p1 GENE.GFYU01014255.1~~GFYU01014255.1.p1  ORF type:complete len:217 (-),score=19.49 GFYU01014255.1:52-702(-)